MAGQVAIREINTNQGADLGSIPVREALVVVDVFCLLWSCFCLFFVFCVFVFLFIYLFIYLFIVFLWCFFQ